MPDFGGGGVLGGLGGIVAGLAAAVRSFAGITARQLLQYLRYVRDHLLELSKALYKGLKETAKALARNVRALARLTRDGLRSFFSWARRWIEALHTFLKTKLGPVLRFIEKVRKRLDEIYRKYVRPVLDTIDFLRAVNRVLQVFHIDALKKLDAVLGAIENEIEDRFAWARSQITRIDNWLDRVIGLDGLYQRFTLIASLRRHAPGWIANFWNDQVTPSRGRPAGSGPSRLYPERDPGVDVAQLETVIAAGAGAPAGIVGELAAQLMLVARGDATPAIDESADELDE